MTRSTPHLRAVLEVYEPYLARRVRVGKFDVTPDGTPCYTVDLVGNHDRMEKLDAWGICPAVYTDSAMVAGALLDRGRVVVEFPNLANTPVARIRGEAEAYLIEKGVL